MHGPWWEIQIHRGRPSAALKNRKRWQSSISRLKHMAELRFPLAPDDVLAHEPAGEFGILTQNSSQNGHVLPRGELSIKTHVDRVRGPRTYCAQLVRAFAIP